MSNNPMLNKESFNWSVKTKINRYLFGYLFSLVKSSCRYSIYGVNTVTNLFREKRHVICTFWHRELIGMLSIWSGIFRKNRLQALYPEDRLVLPEFLTLDLPSCSAVVVSASKDGEIVSYFLKRLGFSVIRGSSGSQGMQAALGVIRYFRKRADQPAFVVMIADGSRGPAGEVQKGIAMMARLTRAFVLPCSCAASLYLTIPSWDRMFVPLPLSRVLAVAGTPLDPREYDEFELITRIKNSLDNCHQQALGLIK